MASQQILIDFVALNRYTNTIIAKEEERKLIDKINAISKAIECECYLPALALALTLPDICGQIEHPDYVDERGQRQGRRQYITWFNDHVKSYPSSDFQFDGRLCYALRCSLLHEGNFELKDKNGNLLVDKFKLHIDKAYGRHNIHCSYYEENGKKIINLDAFGLCFLICMSAVDFCARYDKSVFEKYDSVITDDSWLDSEYNKLFGKVDGECGQP